MELESFYALSVQLTGFEKVDLQGTAMAETYLGLLRDIVGDEVVAEIDAAWARALSESGGDPTQLKTGIRVYLLGNAKLGPVVRNLIKLWYMGNWYPLSAEWQETYVSSPANDGPFATVVSKDSYLQGLAWKAMNRNPKGALWPGWATWAFPPDHLDGVFWRGA